MTLGGPDEVPRAVAKLQALIRIPTVSYREPGRQDTAAFEFEIRQPEKLPMGIGHCRRSLGSQEYAGTEQRQGDSKR